MFSIAGPERVHVVSGIAGKLPSVPTIGVHQKDVHITLSFGAKRYLASIRRPGGKRIESFDGR